MIVGINIVFNEKGMTDATLTCDEPLAEAQWCQIVAELDMLKDHIKENISDMRNKQGRQAIYRS